MPRLIKHLDNPNWLQKILTQNEREQYHALHTPRRKLEYLSGRYACKEAYAKALGTGIGHVDFQDFEILRLENGQPYAKGAQVSISHDEDYAIGMVMVDV